MKYLVNLFIIVLTIFTISCDEVSKPYLQDNGSTPIDTSIKKKILLEDYTGFKCGNCPYAHQTIHNLTDKYPENIVPIAVHCSFFAMPDPKHNYDFRTTIGTEWDNFFGLSSSGLPKGMINRIGFLNNEHILNHDSWEQVINQALSTDAIVNINLDANLQGNTINIKVDYNYKTKLTNYHNLNVLIVEDSIVQYQKWYGHDPEDVDDYLHMHVLRANVNNTWGDKLDSQSGTKNYSFNIPDGVDWKTKNLKVVAFISDVGNTYEVFQAEETAIK